MLCSPLFVMGVSALSDPVPWNYNDYVTDVIVDGDNDLVSFDVPKDFTFITVYNKAIDYREVSHTGTLNGQFPQGAQWYSSYVNPIDSRHPLSVKNIPEGATLTVETRVTIPTQNTIEWSTATAKVNVIYMNDEWEDVYVDSFGATFAPMMTIPIDIKKVDGATSLAIVFWFPDIYAYLMNDYSYTVEISRIHCDMAISSLYRMPEVTQQSYKLMMQINQQLKEQGMTMQDILDKQDQTNDKLDDVNQNLESLPGEIGGAIQDVIENEKQEAGNAGNEFVDQILDALPDPSADVLAALKGLTDATSYTGTEAVLPIPAIVLPAIDGLFPETTVWGGTRLDFGEYLEFLPPPLLVLVQSLFTVAIVLFCVYELKGVVSFCLTLRSNKGG